MRPLALLPLGIAFGLAAEWASDGTADLTLAGLDLAVGCVLLACGVVGWERRPESRVGVLLCAAGVTWFLGTLFGAALYLHRGPLSHVVLSYPTGRPRKLLARVVVGAAYVYAAVRPLAANDALTLLLGGLLVLVAVQGFLGTSGPARTAGRAGLGAAVAFAGVLALGAVERIAGWGLGDLELWAYDLVIASVAVVLVVDLLRGRWAEAVVTGLVVDLGAPAEVATLRGKLARALGDPSLVVGYRLSDTDEFVDDAGGPVKLPSAGSGSAVTAVDDGDDRVAVLVHDATLLSDPQLLESVAAATRLAVSNARLQAEARARADDLEASRYRLVEAGDAQRRRLEEELRLGAERRLESVRTLLAQARRTTPDGEAIRALEEELDEARGELREFAQGIHPAALTANGLVPALALLAKQSPLAVELKGDVVRLPAPIEAALFFVCSEALANVGKHATAGRASIELREEGGRVFVSIVDDGVGGARQDRGTGLRGLADRVEALGGRLTVESPPGHGTRVVAELPRAPSARG